MFCTHLLRTAQICSKIEGLDGKTEQNRLEMFTLRPFFQKPTVFIEKRKPLIEFLL